MNRPLKWDVFVSSQIPAVTSELPPGATEMKWSPISSTLISAAESAVGRRGQLDRAFRRGRKISNTATTTSLFDRVQWVPVVCAADSANDHPQREMALWTIADRVRLLEIYTVSNDVP
jgi:hypothetical protein